MDPYKILGISDTATDDEIKRAYRQLAKKYHPDMNMGASNIEELEDRFKLVQEAYALIMDAREKGYAPSRPQNHGGASRPRGTYTSSSGSFKDFDPHGWSNDYYGGPGQRHSKKPLEYQAAERYINAGRFFEATNTLSSVPEDKRDAKWLYLYALANAGLGNITQARELAGKASRMEPDRPEYRRLHEQLSGTTNKYRQRSRDFGGGTARGGYAPYDGDSGGAPCARQGLACLGIIGFGFLLNHFFCRC